jgi:nicotinamidase-related amidase
MSNTANIVFLIDIQNGFARYDLSDAQGGTLYVPGGEKAGEPAASLIHHARNTIFVLSQDYHPRGHISFMTSHPGIMEWRKERLRAKSVAEADLDTAMLNPLILPFDDILLDRAISWRDHGNYSAVACGVGTEWRDVYAFQGRISGIRDNIIPLESVLKSLRQKLWSPHCQQGTESALFAPPIMDALPSALVAKLKSDITSPVLSAADERGNTFYVVRKGTNSDLDSYGIATENDPLMKTRAVPLFRTIAQQLKKDEVVHVNSYIGGLATNFCVEFSDNDVHSEFLPLLDKLNISYSAFYLSDISYGLPISVPSGAWPDLANAEKRMLAKGKQSCTTEDVIRANLAGRTPAWRGPAPPI